MSIAVERILEAGIRYYFNDSNTSLRPEVIESMKYDVRKILRAQITSDVKERFLGREWRNRNIDTMVTRTLTSAVLAEYFADNFIPPVMRSKNALSSELLSDTRSLFQDIIETVV